jgi:hypothetical protein
MILLLRPVTTVLKHRPWSRALCRWNAIFVALTALTGCDSRPTRVPVSGKVLIDGQPLKFGGVTFVPEGGRSSSGALDQDGKFSLTCLTPNDGALIGKHQIQVIATETINDTTIRIHAPKKYGELQSSGLSEEIKGPTDTVVINLTWKGNVPDKPYLEKFGSPEDEAPRARLYRKKSPENQASMP